LHIYIYIYIYIFVTDLSKEKAMFSDAHPNISAAEKNHFAGMCTAVGYVCSIAYHTERTVGEESSDGRSRRLLLYEPFHGSNIQYRFPSIVVPHA
jgi:hypothetical protein